MLVWYGQLKTKSFIEARLLPSICSILSDYLQRELDFGKIQWVSPLGISLQSCSIGPYHEEFSCGAVSTMKLRLRPFASLRRGKIVMDAILSQPSILIAQKEDFSWLGIPPPSEIGLQKHRSTEEGIDYRTKVRRIAREDAAAYWAIRRRELARQSAEMGYIVPQRPACIYEENEIKDTSSQSIESPGSTSFFCMDERMHWRDHHCMDMGSENGLKHADLEKSFGIKNAGQGPKSWTRIISTPLRYGLTRKARRKEFSGSGNILKTKILELSAAAALAYFRGLEAGRFDGPYMQQETPSTAGGVELPQADIADINNEEVSSANTTNSGGSEHENPEDGQNSVYAEKEKHVEHETLEVADGHCQIEGNTQQVKNTHKDMEHGENLVSGLLIDSTSSCCRTFSFIREPFLMAIKKIGRVRFACENLPLKSGVSETVQANANDTSNECSKQVHSPDAKLDSQASCSSLGDPMLVSGEDRLDNNDVHKTEVSSSSPRLSSVQQSWSVNQNLGFPHLSKVMGEMLSNHLANHIQKLKASMSIKAEDLAAELGEGVDAEGEGVEKMLPVTLDSVYFTDGTLMLLGYGDREPSHSAILEMENVNGHVKFQDQYGRAHVQLSGNCKSWRSDVISDGGFLAADVFVDNIEQKWHANLKIANLFVPLFERILEIPIAWYRGRASGEVHICMSRGETFPNLHGQLDVNGLDFQILDAPSCFSETEATLCFRGQRIFLHSGRGWFGDVPLEASGDFGLNPEDGEFHLMCQVPCVEVNALMKTFKMRPLLVPVAGSITAVFNCQGPLDAPIFVGSGMATKKTAHIISELPTSYASEAVKQNKDAGAVAAFDRIADLYGIRATLLDGGEIRGAGNAWICTEGEMDDSAMDVNLSGNLSSFDKVISRYLPQKIQLVPLKIGELNGETKLSGSLLRPRFDIKWAAPKAEESFSDARGDIIISHEYITVSSQSIAFDLYTKVQTSYASEYLQHKSDVKSIFPFAIEGIELDFRMRGFEFLSLISSKSFDAPRPLHLKATGRIKFHGNVSIPMKTTKEEVTGSEKNMLETRSLTGEVFLTGIKLNQLMLAPQLVGSLSISHENMKLEAMGRPDENLTVEVVGPLFPAVGENIEKTTMLSFALQKGQLRANMSYQPQCSANLEVRHLPLDELELASLRGTVQREIFLLNILADILDPKRHLTSRLLVMWMEALTLHPVGGTVSSQVSPHLRSLVSYSPSSDAEVQLNFPKRRGHGTISVLHPKFSGVLGEALDVAARWSGDVITVEKSILQQPHSRYELQGEYVMPGARDRYPPNKERDGLLKRAMGGHLGSVISSMGRWRMRLEVPVAEVAEMLPLARLLSHSFDPAVRSRSKDLFIQSLQSMGFYAESLRELLKEIQRYHTSSDEVILEDVPLPGLAELKGRWRGSLDASGGGNGDTMADFDFRGEDWEWGTYKTQRVLAVGAYSNDDGLRLDQIFIQRDNATIHADGTLLGPKTNLHFAVLNFPVGLVPTLVQVIESSTTDTMHSLRQLLTPIKGILHMEGDLRGSLAKPECDVQVRLLDGAIGGIDLARAEIVASITSTSRFLFNANFEPVIQSGHVHFQGSVPVTSIQSISSEEEDNERQKSRSTWIPGWTKEKATGSVDETGAKKLARDRTEEGWDVQLAESLKGLNWNILDVGEVRIDADIKDGGMMLITALCPYANWLHGSADIVLQVRGTVEQPVVDGSASFHRATVSSPVIRKPLTNLGGTVHVKSNRLCVSSLESRVSRKGKLWLKGDLPLRTWESCPGDKIDLKCEVLEVRAKNVLRYILVDSQIQITGSILQPNVSGMIKLSCGEAYLPHDKGNDAATNRLVSRRSSLPIGGRKRITPSGHISRFFGTQSTSSPAKFSQTSGKHTEVESKMEQENTKPILDVRLSDLKLLLGPELRMVYPLILDFAVSGELELNGMAHPKRIKPKGILTFENGDVNLVATQVRLKRDHLNIAKFEPDLGLDPVLDLTLVGSEWQFRIQSPASKWQDNLVVTSTRSVEQDAFSPSEVAPAITITIVFKCALAVSGVLKMLRVSTYLTNLPAYQHCCGLVVFGGMAARIFESQLAGSLLEGDGQLAFEKLATATLETLMPRIEGKGEFGQARWRLVYAPQIPSLLSVDPTVDPLKLLANSISFGTEVEVQLGKRLQNHGPCSEWVIMETTPLEESALKPYLEFISDSNKILLRRAVFVIAWRDSYSFRSVILASVVRQMKDSEMSVQLTLIYQLTSRLRVLFHSTPSSDSKRLLFDGWSKEIGSGKEQKAERLLEAQIFRRKLQPTPKSACIQLSLAFKSHHDLDPG
ncbi:hypothetical protein ACLOJK_031852 [Asimina triloba]